MEIARCRQRRPRRPELVAALALVWSLGACDGETPTPPVPIDAIFGADGSLIVLGKVSRQGTTPDPMTGEIPLVDDIWVGRLDEDEAGTERWQTVLGNVDTIEGATGLAETTDGLVLVAGFAFADPMMDADGWLVALRDDGGSLYQRLLQEMNLQELRDVAALSDGDFVAVGSTVMLDGMDLVSGMLVVRFDSAGEPRWTPAARVLRAPMGSQLSGQRVVERLAPGIGGESGTTIVLGVLGSMDPMVPVDRSYVAALDVVGTLQWHRELDAEGGFLATRIRVLGSGDLAVVGHSALAPALDPMNPPPPRRDMRVALLDGASGEPIWDLAWDVEEGDEVPHAILELEDGRLAVIGSSDAFGTRLEGDTDLWVLVLATDGTVEEQFAVGGSGPDRPLAVREGEENVLHIVGVTGEALTSWRVTADGTLEAGCGATSETNAITVSVNLTALAPEVTPTEQSLGLETHGDVAFESAPLAPPICTP